MSRQGPRPGLAEILEPVIEWDLKLPVVPPVAAAIVGPETSASPRSTPLLRGGGGGGGGGGERGGGGGQDPFLWTPHHACFVENG